MSDKAYLVKGQATITLSGIAKIIDIDGNVLRTCDLSTGDPVVVELKTCTRFWPENMCGVTFTIDDVFAGRVVKIAAPNT